MEDLRIVPADTAELLYNIEALADDIWHEYLTPVLGQPQVDYILENFQSVDAINSQIMNGYEYFVLIYEYLMAGYVGMKEDDRTLFLSGLYIHEECQGNHIATNVFQFLLGICRKRNLNCIRLTCSKKNSKALEVFKHLGFTVVKEQLTDIGGGFSTDDYILEYALTD